MLDLHQKAEFYHRDEQYFNALKMYEIILKNDERDYAAYFGAILSEYGARFIDDHEGGYTFSCARTHSESIYDGEYYKKLRETAPASALEYYESIIADIANEQKKNNEQYLASAPVDEVKDYRAEARSTDDALSDDYLQARERYLEREREEKEAAEKRRLEAKMREEAAQKARENRANLERKRKARKKKAIIISAACAALCLIVCLCVFLVVPMIRYSTAMSDIEKGDYDKAAKTLRDIEWFSDSASVLSSYRFYGLEAGDVVTFGNYEQDGYGSADPIEWIVLKSDDNTVTLISKYVLDCVKYDEKKDKPSYWESCTLRAWLNGEFFSTAFSADEAKFVSEITNANPDNVKCGTKGGADTTDRVYLLSIDEAKALLSAEQIFGTPTDYAISRGVYTKSDYDATYWWLRSPGASQNSAAKANYEGKIDERGSGVDYSSYGVRPCITIMKSVIE